MEEGRGPKGIDSGEATQGLDDSTLVMHLPDAYEFQSEANQRMEAYTPQEIDARIYVVYTEQKGRCLFSRHSLVPGDVIYVEKPLASVYPSLNNELWQIIQEVAERYKTKNKEFELPLAWHFAALYTIITLDESDLNKIKDKYHPETTEGPSEEIIDVLSVAQKYPSPRLHRTNPKEYEEILYAWRYNCFGHHEENEGLVIYDRISMIAHCCDSSATWHYSPDQYFVLRARKQIAADEEITISYIGDEEVYKTADMRRERLLAWMFHCQCVKCSEDVDKSRGLRCPYCGFGTIYLRTEDDQSTSAALCSRCVSVLTVEQLIKFLNYESAYNERISGVCIGADDESGLLDAETVLVEAERVMTNHYLIYDLHTKLYNAYKANQDDAGAIYHLEGRINYINQTCQPASFTIAWLYEELGDLLINMELKRQAGGKPSAEWPSDADLNICLPLHLKNRIVRIFEDTMNILLSSCGDTHSYTLTAHWKMEFISTLPVTSSTNN